MSWNDDIDSRQVEDDSTPVSKIVGTSESEPSRGKNAVIGIIVLVLVILGVAGVGGLILKNRDKPKPEVSPPVVDVVDDKEDDDKKDPEVIVGDGEDGDEWVSSGNGSSNAKPPVELPPSKEIEIYPVPFDRLVVEAQFYEVSGVVVDKQVMSNGTNYQGMLEVDLDINGNSYVVFHPVSVEQFESSGVNNRVKVEISYTSDHRIVVRSVK